MRHLVVGAGASIAQAKELNLPEELWPPLMANFARKTWSNYLPWPFLPAFLGSKGIAFEKDQDLREVFYDLELNEEVNIEQFIEFAWREKDNLPPDMADSWNDFMRFGIGDPIALLINQGFYKNGTGFVDLPVTRRVLARFTPDDMVLSLNYDTLIEIALLQSGRKFTYLPNQETPESLPVCKPHGSLNMAFDEDTFSFGNPTNLFPLFQTGDTRRAYIGLIPPRLNKTYAQTPMARIILDPVRKRAPESVVMWGIGMTESDVDINDIYKDWAKSAKVIDVINPNASIASRIETLSGVQARHFSSAEDWLLQDD